MSDKHAVTDAAAFCADDVRTHDFERYAASLFATPTQRRALLALEAFRGEIARVRDHISQPLPGEIRLQWWIDTLNGAGHGGVEGNPIAAELLHAIGEFRLPVEDLVRLVEAYRFDLYDDPMPTMDALESYLDETASLLLSLAVRICGAGPGGLEDLIRHAGRAQGLVRVVRLLPVHAARHQLYLPQELLQLNAVETDAVFAGTATPQLRTVLAYICREAHQHLDAALDALAAAPPGLGAAFLPLVSARMALARIERADFDPFRQSLPSRLAVLWTLWRASRRGPFAAVVKP
jgi:15-cis-phytoene synthase